MKTNTFLFASALTVCGLGCSADGGGGDPQTDTSKDGAHLGSVSQALTCSPDYKTTCGGNPSLAADNTSIVDSAVAGNLYSATSPLSVDNYSHCTTSYVARISVGGGTTPVYFQAYAAVAWGASAPTNATDCTNSHLVLNAYTDQSNGFCADEGQVTHNGVWLSGPSTCSLLSAMTTNDIRDTPQTMYVIASAYTTHSRAATTYYPVTVGIYDHN